jgi:hypothetical protein
MTSWRRLQGLVLGCALTAGTAPADERIVVTEEIQPGTVRSEEYITTLKQLQQLSEQQLEQLFAQAEAAPIPVGFSRGQVLVLTRKPFPKLGAWAAGLVWKGKHFDENGKFINQWLGFRALHSHAMEGPSWYDGRPCLVLEYPPGTPLFANMRDELREIGPGLYLARAYQRTPHPLFRGFIAMQLQPEKGRHAR